MEFTKEELEIAIRVVSEYIQEGNDEGFDPSGMTAADFRLWCESHPQMD